MTKSILYNKLIRDNIPEIIAQDGKIAITEVLNDEEYFVMLKKKLQEEVDEFMQSGTVEELADIGEVMHAIMDLKNIALDEFQRVRLEKLKKNGGFHKRLLLREVKTN